MAAAHKYTLKIFRSHAHSVENLMHTFHGTVGVDAELGTVEFAEGHSVHVYVSWKGETLDHFGFKCMTAGHNHSDTVYTSISSGADHLTHDKICDTEFTAQWHQIHE